MQHKEMFYGFVVEISFPHTTFLNQNLSIVSIFVDQI